MGKARDIRDNKDFRCKHCGLMVPRESYGTKNRNHCPFCLWSLHVDNSIGDRLSDCNGRMKPIALTTKKDGEIMLIHECQSCGKIMPNRLAGDDSNDEVINIFNNSIKNKEEINKRTKLEVFDDFEELKIQLFGK